MDVGTGKYDCIGKCVSNCTWKNQERFSQMEFFTFNDQVNQADGSIYKYVE